MIIDKCKYIENYKSMLPCLDNALSALKGLGDDPQVGRYEFEGGFFMIQEGDTRSLSDGDYEAHRKYIDVQVILDGSELIAWKDIEDLKTSEAYDEGKDKEMLGGSDEYCMTVSKGMFWAAFPADAHKACRDTGKTTHYKKAVIKLPVA